MAWKKYSEMSDSEKKESWKRFRESHQRKKIQEMRDMNTDSHPRKDHKPQLNPGGYCNICGAGRDFS